jgi:uncharacterized membrane protein YedE/YeeE
MIPAPIRIAQKERLTARRLGGRLLGEAGDAADGGADRDGHGAAADAVMLFGGSLLGIGWRLAGGWKGRIP